MADKYGVGNDPYCYPNTDILINKFDIQNEDDLIATEVELTNFRILQFSPSFSDLSFSYLKYIHHFLFQDLYSWAGEIRNVDISKGNTRFCNVSRIGIEVEKCFSYLHERDCLINLPKDKFIQSLAHFFCEMNVVHPFREGNGRALRLFCEVLAIQAGYQVSWANLSAQYWLDANIAGYMGDLTLLELIFENSITKIQL